MKTKKLTVIVMKKPMMKKRNPQQQLESLLQTPLHKSIMLETLELLNPHAQEDFCLAAIAYIKFGIRRPFSNRLMMVITESYYELLDK